MVVKKFLLIKIIYLWVLIVLIIDFDFLNVNVSFGKFGKYMKLNCYLVKLNF